jgi:hypothetical protein
MLVVREHTPWAAREKPRTIAPGSAILATVELRRSRATTRGTASLTRATRTPSR